jgi:hypothetical protein
MTFFLAPGNLPLLPGEQTQARNWVPTGGTSMAIVHGTDNSDMLNLLNGGAGCDRRRRHDPPRRHPRSGGLLAPPVN